MKISNTNLSIARATSGQTVARGCKIIDLGTQVGMYDFKPTRQHKILVGFELPTGAVVTKIYTASLNARATLRKDIESWNGAPFTPGELNDFDLEWMIDRYCKLHVRPTGDPYAGRMTVENIRPVEQTDERHRSMNKNIVFSLKQPDPVLFMSFSQGIRRMIEASEEWPQVRDVLTETPTLGQVGSGRNQAANAAQLIDAA